MSSLREKILSAKDIKTEVVNLEEWDVTVEVRTLTGAQRAEVKKGSTDTERNSEGEEVKVVNEAKLQAAIAIASVFEPGTDKPVFELADRDALTGKSAAVLDKILVVAGRLSGITVTEQKAMEKNSEATPSVATTSA
jgi:hypothetical protein